MLFIETKYDTPGRERIKASHGDSLSGIILDYDHGITPLGNHRRAAMTLYDKLDYEADRVNWTTFFGGLHWHFYSRQRFLEEDGLLKILNDAHRDCLGL